MAPPVLILLLPVILFILARLLPGLYRIFRDYILAPDNLYGQIIAATALGLLVFSLMTYYPPSRAFTFLVLLLWAYSARRNHMAIREAELAARKRVQGKMDRLQVLAEDGQRMRLKYRRLLNSYRRVKNAQKRGSDQNKSTEEVQSDSDGDSDSVSAVGPIDGPTVS